MRTEIVMLEMLITRREGMIAANQERLARDQALAYPEQEFVYLGKQIETLISIISDKKEAGKVTDKTIKGCAEGLAHEIWAAAQLMPGEGIKDGVERIMLILLNATDHLKGNKK
jgi:hypothetical protein